MEDETRYRWIADHVLPFEQEMRRWLRRKARTLSSHDLDDLVQEGYAHLLRANLSVIRNGRSFFRSTIRNLWLDQRRRSHVVQIERLDDAGSLHIDEAPGPEQRASARQQLERLVQVVQRLPPRQRAAFESKQFAGLCTREIAQRMNIAEKTVEMHLRLALAQVMRSLLGDDEVCPQASEVSEIDNHEAARKRD